MIKKQKTLDANENESKPQLYRCTAKYHAFLFPNNVIPLYLEGLRFLIKRCGWKVTTICIHFALEQSRFKRDFVLNNQRKRQKAKTSIENNFYKLMRNVVFYYGCIDNTNNGNFQPIIDEVNEITYIEKIIIFSTEFQKL